MRVILGGLAGLLMLEALASGLRFTRVVPLFPAYPALTIVMLLLRAGVAVVQFSGGFTLAQRRPAGRMLARTALLASAVLTTFEIGFRWAPTSLFPAYRWPAVGIYWGYALTGIWLLKRENNGGAGLQTGPERPV